MSYIFFFPIRKVSANELESLINFTPLVKKSNQYIFLSSESNIVNIRKKRLEYSKKFQKDLNLIIPIFKLVPFIKMIAISGSLATNNINKKNADIDLFMILSDSKNIIFYKTFLKLLSKLMSLFKFDVCINYIKSLDDLEIEHKNFYTAKEALLVKPIYNELIYDQFLNANKWISDYYPNHHKMRHLNVKKAHKCISVNFWLVNLSIKLCFIIYIKLKKIFKMNYSELNHHIKLIHNPGYYCILKNLIKEKLHKYNVNFEENEMAFLFPEIMNYKDTCEQIRLKEFKKYIMSC